jgi:hypothetical protein
MVFRMTGAAQGGTALPRDGPVPGSSNHEYISSPLRAGWQGDAGGSAGRCPPSALPLLLVDLLATLLTE